jgi:hypothetical protein
MVYVGRGSENGSETHPHSMTRQVDGASDTKYFRPQDTILVAGIRHVQMADGSVNPEWVSNSVPPRNVDPVEVDRAVVRANLVTAMTAPKALSTNEGQHPYKPTGFSNYMLNHFFHACKLENPKVDKDSVEAITEYLFQHPMEPACFTNGILGLVSFVAHGYTVRGTIRLPNGQGKYGGPWIQILIGAWYGFIAPHEIQPSIPDPKIVKLVSDYCDIICAYASLATCPIPDPADPTQFETIASACRDYDTRVRAFINERVVELHTRKEGSQIYRTMEPIMLVLNCVAGGFGPTGMLKEQLGSAKATHYHPEEGVGISPTKSYGSDEKDEAPGSKRKEKAQRKRDRDGNVTKGDLPSGGVHNGNSYRWVDNAVFQKLPQAEQDKVNAWNRRGRANSKK